jgi:hypothetical protein
VKLKCGDQVFRTWEDFNNKAGRIWIYSTDINHGCFVVAFVSNKGIYVRHDGQLSPHSKPLSKKYIYHGEPHYEAWVDDTTQEIIDHYGTFKDTLRNGRLFVVVPKDGGDKESEESKFSRKCIESLVKRVSEATEMEAKILEYDVKEETEGSYCATFEVNMDSNNDIMPHPYVFLNGLSCWEIWE